MIKNMYERGIIVGTKTPEILDNMVNILREYCEELDIEFRLENKTLIEDEHIAVIIISKDKRVDILQNSYYYSDDIKEFEDMIRKEL